MPKVDSAQASQQSGGETYHKQLPESWSQEVDQVRAGFAVNAIKV
jgi:hypothetical protein